MTTTRREFIAQIGAMTVLGAAGERALPLAGDREPRADTAPVPWYRRTLRWGQTNITEIDPGRYDIAWWREYWTRTAIQGVIVNAGGIVAYYPSRYPLQHRALAPRRPRSVRRPLARRPRAGADGRRADGLQPRARAGLPRAPRLDRGGRQRRAVSQRRPVRDLHQRPVLPRLPSRHHAGDRRARATRRLHRQQLERARSQQHLLLRELPARLPWCKRTRSAAAPRLGRRGIPTLDRVELRAPPRAVGARTTP